MLFNVVAFWPAHRQALRGWPDLSIFYTAGTMLRRGQAQLLYSDGAQSLIQGELFPEPFAGRGLLPYNHPPFEALPYAAITQLPYVDAYFLMFAVNVLLLIGCIHILKPWLPGLRSMFPRFMYVVPFAFFPVAYALVQGQDSILLLMLYSVAYVSLRRSQDLRAGAVLGLGLFKFHLVLPFVFILALRQRWRALMGVLLSASIEVVISWMIVGTRTLAQYPVYILQVNRRRSPGVIIVPDNMPNLRGLFMVWGKETLPVEIALVVASVCILVWAAYRWRPADLGDANAWNTGFSLAVVASFLAGFHSYGHDMSILLLPTLLTFECVRQRWLPMPIPALRVILILMFLSPLHYWLTMHVSREALFALVLIAWVVFLADSGRGRPAIEPQMAERVG
jgi:hypothetical protein